MNKTGYESNIKTNKFFYLAAYVVATFILSVLLLSSLSFIHSENFNRHVFRCVQIVAWQVDVSIFQASSGRRYK